MDDTAQKLEFAAHLLKMPDKALEAACLVFPANDQLGKALQVAQQWPNDPLVRAEQTRILGTGDARAFLPTKEVQAQAIYALAEDKMAAVEDRLKAHKLYAELMGFIEKPLPGIQQNILNQGVMIVPMVKSDDDWEAGAIEQQRRLTATSVN